MLDNLVERFKRKLGIDEESHLRFIAENPGHATISEIAAGLVPGARETEQRVDMVLSRLNQDNNLGLYPATPGYAQELVNAVELMQHEINGDSLPWVKEKAEHMYHLIFDKLRFIGTKSGGLGIVNKESWLLKNRYALPLTAVVAAGIAALPFVSDSSKKAVGGHSVDDAINAVAGAINSLGVTHAGAETLDYRASSLGPFVCGREGISCGKGIIYVIEEGIAYGDEEDKPRDVKRIARQEAIDKALDRIGAVYITSTRELRENETRRYLPNGKLISDLVEEFIVRSKAEYLSKAAWDVLSERVTPISNEAYKITSRLVVRVSEEDYQRFFEEKQREANEGNLRRARQDSIYDVAKHDLRMLKNKSEALAYQERIGEDQQLINESRAEVSRLQDEIRKNYRLLEEILKAAESGSVSPAELDGYRRRKEELANDEMMPSLGAANGFGGRIAFASDRDGNPEIYVMDADGNNPRRLTYNLASDGSPSWSPDGSKIAFLRDSYFTYVTNIDGNEPRFLVNGSCLIWSPDGSEAVYINEVNLQRRPYKRIFEIYVMDADGNYTRILTSGSSARDEDLSWSPDGSKIAFVSDRDGNNEIYVMDANGKNQTRITHNSANDYNPSWSPDGSRIAFTSVRKNIFDIYVIDAEGNETNLTHSPTYDGHPSWSPDGSKIAFVSDRDGNNEIYVMDANGKNQTRITFDEHNDHSPSWWSPNRLPAPPSNRAPIPSFTAELLEGSVIYATRFDASRSYEPDFGDRIVRYDWDWGKGFEQSSTEPVVTHAFHSEGRFTVGLRVTDNRGASRSETLDVIIGEKAETEGQYQGRKRVEYQGIIRERVKELEGELNQNYGRYGSTAMGFISPVWLIPMIGAMDNGTPGTTSEKPSNGFRLVSSCQTLLGLAAITNITNNSELAISAYATSVSIGVIYDLWAYDHNKRIDDEIQRLRGLQSSGISDPGRYSLGVNPAERKVTLRYNF
ncbi:MAG: DPP IV N-terminal domain-containing protein [archaeon]